MILGRMAALSRGFPCQSVLTDAERHAGSTERPEGCIRPSKSDVGYEYHDLREWPCELSINECCKAKKNEEKLDGDMDFEGTSGTTMDRKRVLMTEDSTSIVDTI